MDGTLLTWKVYSPWEFCMHIKWKRTVILFCSVDCSAKRRSTRYGHLANFGVRFVTKKYSVTIAIFTQCFQKQYSHSALQKRWFRTDAESSQLMRWNTLNKGIFGAAETSLLKLHYQIRLSGMRIVTPHALRQLSRVLKLLVGTCVPELAGWLDVYPRLARWVHVTG